MTAAHGAAVFFCGRKAGRGSVKKVHPLGLYMKLQKKVEKMRGGGYSIEERALVENAKGEVLHRRKCGWKPEECK